MARIEAQSLNAGEAGWLVRPCTHPLAWGVPLFSRISPDGRLVETSISPLPRAGDWCPHMPQAMHAIHHRPNLTWLLADAVGDIPYCVFDNLHAQLAHKRLTLPRPDDGKFYSGELIAGVIQDSHGGTAALALGQCGVHIGVIAVQRLGRGATICVRWVAPEGFRPDRRGFADCCEGITPEDLLAGLDRKTPLMAMQGAEQCLRDGTRVLPPMVVAAFVRRLMSALELGHPAAVLGQELLEQIHVAEGVVSDDEIASYVETLTRLRQILVLVADKRQPGREEDYERLVASPSWLDLHEAIVDAMVIIHQIADGGKAPEFDRVRHTIERVALSGRDTYSLRMKSFRGRVMAGIGAVVSQPPQIRAGEDAMDARFRSLAQLLGVSCWEYERPYEAGVLAAVMDGW